ncbi:MAG: diguanylate cyclase [Oscillospiraceae bacterium]
MTPHEKINEIFLRQAQYHYCFDLTTGIVEQDIVDKNGTNYMERLGLKSPCRFDELMERSFSDEYLRMWDVSDNKSRLCQEYLMQQYNNGIDLVEKIFYSSTLNIYHRINYYIVPDTESGKPWVFVSCVDITQDEKRRSEVYGKLRDSKSEIDDIVASAQIGIWHIYYIDGEKPRLSATPKMCELLGIAPGEMTEEEMYRYFETRIKKSSLPSVYASIDEMKTKGFSENTYTWIHPTRGEIFVRCGGTSKQVPGGVVLRGYHSDITEIVTAEQKQKQLLEEALEELKKQKKLLEEALDNYKEADYDRRRDFLTGLRNRQDLYDLLQDSLSGKRERISAMYLMDIDSFKKLNDHYGHSYGDECLKRIGAALNAYSESNDMYFYRYGGEEMLGIGFDTDKSADVIAQELVELISSLGIKRDDIETGVVTVSLGYTTDNSAYEEMIDKADNAMYRAKSGGKNRAVCFEKIG